MHANYAGNNRKRDNVKIITIALDLHDVIVDSKKVVLFEYVNSFLYLELETRSFVVFFKFQPTTYSSQGVHSTVIVC